MVAVTMSMINASPCIQPGLGANVVRALRLASPARGPVSSPSDCALLGAAPSACPFTVLRTAEGLDLQDNVALPSGQSL
jgi:hypothetical protein